MSRVDSINQILRSMQSRSPDVEAAALLSNDGLMIASALPQHIDEARVAGMSAALLGLGSRAVRELKRGDLQEVLVRGTDGIAAMLDAGSDTSLLVLTTEEARLGLVFLDMRRGVEEIKAVL